MQTRPDPSERRSARTHPSPRLRLRRSDPSCSARSRPRSTNVTDERQLIGRHKHEKRRIHDDGRWGIPTDPPARVGISRSRDFFPCNRRRVWSDDLQRRSAHTPFRGPLDSRPRVPLSSTRLTPHRAGVRERNLREREQSIESIRDDGRRAAGRRGVPEANATVPDLRSRPGGRRLPDPESNPNPASSRPATHAAGPAISQSASEATTSRMLPVIRRRSSRSIT